MTLPLIDPLRRVQRVLSARYTMAAGVDALTLTQITIMNAMKGGRLGQTALSELSFVDRSTLSTSLKTLSALDLVQFYADTKDRRGQLVSLTPKGARILRRDKAVADEVEREALAALEPDSRGVLLGALVRLCE